MKVLLVGEYNRAHKFLKDALIKLDHEALVVGLTDGFKKAEVDIEIKNNYDKGFRKKWRWILRKLFDYDLNSLDVKRQIIELKSSLSGYDVVQFINESPFICRPHIEQEIFDLLREWNDKVYLLSCGTDHISVKYAYEQKYRYSILTPYFEGRVPKQDYSLGLKYLEPKFKALHEHIYKHINGVISSDFDYFIPLQGHPKHLGLIPHPIDVDQIKFRPLEISDKIVIFHGINRNNYYKKGNDIFDKALDIISLNYSNKVEIITAENLPYAEYIHAFDSAHVLLDQIFAYDQGYNALEAMAKGKVVFTGAEKEWLEHYDLEKDMVAINALPNVDAIVNKLSHLIDHPKELIEISIRARAFVEAHHHYVKCAERYLEVWTSN